MITHPPLFLMLALFYLISGLCKQFLQLGTVTEKGVFFLNGNVVAKCIGQFGRQKCRNGTICVAV